MNWKRLSLAVLSAAILFSMTAVSFAVDFKAMADKYPMFGPNLENADFNAGEWQWNENGELVSPGSGEIWLKQPCGSFICSFEFKAGKHANAGFLIHCSDKVDWVPNSIEIQLLDSYGETPNYHTCGAFYGYQAPSKCVEKAPGEWNQMTIAAFGDKVSVFLNGEKINSIQTSEWTDAKVGPAGTEIEEKFQGKPLASEPPYGYVGLQGKHSDAQMTYRNLSFVPLAAQMIPEEGWESLFGDALENAEFDPAVWSVDSEGVLHAAKDEAIWSKKSWDNFALDFEFQTTKNANSGVIIECSDKANWIPNSFEVQIFDSFGQPNDKTQCGAVYGRCAPMFNVCKTPGEWNRMTILVQDKLVIVILNGEMITYFDKSLWTDPKLNPDGSEAFAWLVNKAPCETPNSGFIGFQGLHANEPVAYRNIRICPNPPALSCKCPCDK